MTPSPPIVQYQNWKTLSPPKKFRRLLLTENTIIIIIFVKTSVYNFQVKVKVNMSPEDMDSYVFCLAQKKNRPQSVKGNV